MKETLKSIGRVLVVLAILTCIIGNIVHVHEKYWSKQDAVPYIDTIEYYVPVPKDSLVIRYKTVKVPIKGDNDSEKPVDTVSKECPAVPDRPVVSPDIKIDTTDTKDSLTIELPITQKVYADSLYSIWISGYDVHLDSLKFYHEKPIIPKDPLLEWSVGVQAGVGWFGDGFKPYVGIGVQLGIDMKKIRRKRKH